MAIHPWGLEAVEGPLMPRRAPRHSLNARKLQHNTMLRSLTDVVMSSSPPSGLPFGPSLALALGQFVSNKATYIWAFLSDTPYVACILLLCIIGMSPPHHARNELCGAALHCQCSGYVAIRSPTPLLPLVHPTITGYGAHPDQNAGQVRRHDAAWNNATWVTVGWYAALPRQCYGCAALV